MKKIIKGIYMCDYLDNHGISYEWCIKHPEVRGCDESARYYSRYQYLIGDNYCIGKHLLLQERKGEKRVFLFIVPSDKQVDLKEVRERLQTSKLEFVKEDKMEELLYTTPGNVSIFNLIYDSSKKVNLVLDQDLLNTDLVAFHPLYNGMSVFLKPEDMLKFLAVVNRDYNLGDVPSLIPTDSKTLSYKNR